ncbi:small heat shock protein [Trichuris trichiura]|uniref:Small heat shock protein n=1 Tax=Trichuris trichiura TaxID=36087 RepID=A0A077YYH8_TRITR|nr:small heat shock protein [Trichuris trichiura]
MDVHFSSCPDDETAAGAATKKTNDDVCKAPNRKESSTPQFNAIDNPTVYTRRGLIRGERTLEALKVMHSLASINCSYGAVAPLKASHSIDQCCNASSSAPNSPSVGSRRRLHPVVFGQGGFNDRSSTLWEWPLGTASVSNTDDNFEVELYFSPFTAKEITAKVMGNELLIHCKSDALLSANDPHPREIFRSYQMPLNVDPKTVRFSIKEERYLSVKAKKERPLKLALAYDTNSDKCIN